MRKKTERKLQHNIGEHAERMAKRRAVQRLRVRNIPFRASSKYIPLVEDVKHKEE